MSDVATYGMIVTNADRFAVAGNMLKFKVDTGSIYIPPSERIALVTIPEEDASEIDSKRIVFEHNDINGRIAVLEKDRVTYSGISCVRYSCRLAVGLKLIIR
jgi:hypothetical protein